MATRMSLWKLDKDSSAIEVPEQPLEAENQIESAVDSAPELLGVDVLIIGRQTLTPSGPLDMLGIDEEGRLVVVENKRDRTPREVLAQIIDYAAWIDLLTFDQVDSIYREYQENYLRPKMPESFELRDLTDAFEERFDVELDAIAVSPRMLIVASRLDDTTERMIDFLTDSFNVPINAVLFQHFEGGFIGRTWLRSDLLSARVSGHRSSTGGVQRTKAKIFWDAWLPVAQKVVTGIKLDPPGPLAVSIKRRIHQDIPASLVVWSNVNSAYAVIQFENPDRAMNEELLNALKRRSSEVEEIFEDDLDWDEAAVLGGKLPKFRKIATPRVSISERTQPTDTELQELADIVQRLLDAVRPHLDDVFEEATSAGAVSPNDQDDVGSEPTVELEE